MIMLILKIAALFRVKELIWVVFFILQKSTNIISSYGNIFSTYLEVLQVKSPVSGDPDLGMDWSPTLSHIPAAAFFISATLTVTKGLHQWTSCMMVQV